jgi:outer membrane protein OmpU
MKFDTRKALLGTTAIVGASLLAAAPAVAKPTVNIGGALDFQVGWTSQDREGWSPTPGGVVGPSTERGYSFFQRTLITVNATDKTDSGMQWAFRLDLNADADGGPGASNGLKDGTARDASDKVTLDLSDAWGQVSVGADYGVFRTLSFGSKDATKSAGTGGVDGNWARWYNRKSFSGSRFESSTTVRDATTSSRITYVTPRVVGFQAGVTYAMDRTTIGRFREAEAFGTASTQANSVEQNFWAGAVNYVNKFGDFDVGASFAATEANNSNELLQNTRSFHTGVVVGYGPWKVGGRYAWKPDSIDNASTSTNNDYDQWDLGVGFTTGPWSLALSFMRQEQGMTNTNGSASNDVYAFGTTYDMGGGLQLYGEVFHATTKNGASTAVAASNNEGTGLITGVRVKF